MQQESVHMEEEQHRQEVQSLALGSAQFHISVATAGERSFGEDLPRRGGGLLVRAY